MAWGGAGRAVPADLSAPPCYPQTPARFHWTRVPAVPTPCAGIIGLGRGARRPVTPLSTVAVEGMPTVLGPGRPVSTAACPRRPTVKGQVRAYLHSSRGLPRLCPGSGSGVRSRARSPPRLGDLGPGPRSTVASPGSLSAALPASRQAPRRWASGQGVRTTLTMVQLEKSMWSNEKPV